MIDVIHKMIKVIESILIILSRRHIFKQKNFILNVKIYFVFFKILNNPFNCISPRLEQHERMLAERERERREASRSAGLGHRQPSRTDLRPRSVAEDSDRDVPSYMRSTSASIKKEKLGNSPVDKIRLENLFLLHKNV